MTRPDPRTFGRRPAWVSAAELRRKQSARLAAATLLCIGLMALLLAYVFTGGAPAALLSGVPSVAGFLAFILTITGFGALALAILAAREC